MLALNSPSSVMEKLRVGFKEKRLSLNLTQEAVANRSGVSLGSLKRFEQSGQISLDSLLKIAFVIDILDQFVGIGAEQEPKYSSIDEILKERKSRKRGSIK